MLGPGQEPALLQSVEKGLSGFMPSPSYIVPVLIGDPVLCKVVCDELLTRHRIYVQPINHPTVPRGTERPRLTPPPLHSEADIDDPVRALAIIWSELDLRRAA